MAEKAEVVISGKDTTASAFASVQRRLDSLKTSFSAGFAGAGAGFAVAQQVLDKLAVAFDKIDPRTVIDAADQLNKLSQRTGIAVEQLSALEYAGKLADVSTDELATGLKKLNVNIAAAARGEKEQADAFKTIGVSVVDASGKVRDAGAVLGDLADRFQGYNDGANKVAIANAVGGKSFEKFIPFLNSGKKGIEDARAELEKFGGLIGGDLARKSEQFNDNLTRIGVASNALKVSLAGGLIDRMVELSDRMVDAAKNGGLLNYSLERTKEILSGQAGREFVFGKALPADKLQESQQNVADLTEQVGRLQDYLARNPNSAGTQRAIDGLLGKIAAVKGAQTELQAAATQQFRRDEKKGSDFSAAPPPKKDAPALRNSGAGDNAEALLRKQLEGRVKAIQTALENERDLVQFSDSRLAELYSHGDLAIEAYFDQKLASQRAFLAKQQKAFDDEIAALREYQAKVTKPQDKQDAANKIEDVLARQAKAYREAGQAAEVAETQRSRAADEFRKSLVDLDAQMAELSGDKFTAELGRNALRLEEAQKILDKGGGDPARLAQLRDLLSVQAKFNAAVEQNSRITERAQIAEEAFLLEADRAGLNRLDTERGVLRIREQSLSQLDALITKTKALADSTNNPEILAFYDRLRLVREKAFEAKDPSLERLRSAANEAGQSVATELEDIIVEGKKGSDVIKALEKDFVRLVTRDFLTTPLATSFSNFLKNMGGIGGQQAGGVGGGDLFSFIGKFFGLGGGGGSGATSAVADIGAAWYHNGGIAGAAGGTLRPVSAGAFAHAERYHSGGIAGLAHDEVPAILRRREEVLRTDDPRHRDNWGGGKSVRPITNNFILSSPASRDTQAQVALAAARALRQAESRDG